MNVTELARKASILFAYALQQSIKVPTLTKADDNRTPGSREIYHSFTLTSTKEFRAQLEASARQMATGIGVDCPTGVRFYRLPYPELQDRFPGNAISRCEMMGVFVVVLVRAIEGVGAQVTLVTEFDEWQPKQF